MSKLAPKKILKQLYKDQKLRVDVSVSNQIIQLVVDNVKKSDQELLQLIQPCTSC